MSVSPQSGSKTTVREECIERVTEVHSSAQPNSAEFPNDLHSSVGRDSGAIVPKESSPSASTHLGDAILDKSVVEIPSLPSSRSKVTGISRSSGQVVGLPETLV